MPANKTSTSPQGRDHAAQRGHRGPPARNSKRAASLSTATSWTAASTTEPCTRIKMATRQSSATATRRPPQSREPEDGRRYSPSLLRRRTPSPRLRGRSCSPSSPAPQINSPTTSTTARKTRTPTTTTATIFMEPRFSECGMREPGRHKVLAARLTAAPRSPDARDLKTGR
jgi:hypothetical protein